MKRKHYFILALAFAAGMLAGCPYGPSLQPRPVPPPPVIIPQ